jgi:N-acetylneuraminic acid mutarotase
VSRRKLCLPDVTVKFVVVYLSTRRSVVCTFSPRVAFSLLVVGIAFAFAQPSRGGIYGFEETGNMVTAGVNKATLLSTGKVLVTHYYAADLYDPASRTWTPTGNMNQPRGDYTATLLPDGKVLVAGGAGGAVGMTDFDSAELYDPATGTWTFTGSLHQARRAHTATLLPNGKVLVAAGLYELPNSILQSATPLSSAEIYDPATGTWTATGDLIAARYDHTATLLADGKVLVAGGRGGQSRYGPTISTAELYDPASGTWTGTGSLNTERRGHTATLLPSGKVLVASGIDSHESYLASAELYDPQIGTWTPTASFSTVRFIPTATLLATGKVLAVGGIDGSGHSAASAEVFDPSSESWMASGSLYTARHAHTATLLNDGTVLVAGGYRYDGGSSNTPLSSAELYEPMPTLLNISTRMNVQTGDKSVIAGFIISGTERKTVLVRGIGPSLPFAGTLADPVIEVHGPSGQFLGANDNWKDALSSQQISASGLAPTNDLESALWGTLNPGAYTVILTGKNGGTGVGSVEVYDLDEPADSRLANISTRGFVQTGNDVLIGGLIVGGGTPSGLTKVIVRALGPSIPVSGTLANPTVELHDANGAVIDFNDDWKTRADGTSQQAEIESTTIPPSNDLESALVRNLQPGSYTAIVRGKNDVTGIGTVEVYDLP